MKKGIDEMTKKCVEIINAYKQPQRVIDEVFLSHRVKFHSKISADSSDRYMNSQLLDRINRLCMFPPNSKVALGMRTFVLENFPRDIGIQQTNNIFPRGFELGGYVHYNTLAD